MSRTLPRAWLPLIVATIAIAAVVVPWTSFQDHSHWINVRWIPFVSGPARTLTAFEKIRSIAEMVANVILYVPFGFAAYRHFGGWRAVMLAVGLSTFTEWTQLYSHARIPSTTDIVCNLAGAWIGVSLRRRQPHETGRQNLATPNADPM